MEIKYLKSVQKDIRKLDQRIQKKIKDYLEKKISILDDPRILGKSLQGNLSGLWRYRVGDYRIICEIRDEELIVLVVAIGHRSKIYR